MVLQIIQVWVFGRKEGREERREEGRKEGEGVFLVRVVQILVFEFFFFYQSGFVSCWCRDYWKLSGVIVVEREVFQGFFSLGICFFFDCDFRYGVGLVMRGLGQFLQWLVLIFVFFLWLGLIIFRDEKRGVSKGYRFYIFFTRVFYDVFWDFNGKILDFFWG